MEGAGQEVGEQERGCCCAGKSRRWLQAGLDLEVGKEKTSESYDGVGVGGLGPGGGG